jgi:hypothetical protein
MRGTPLRDVSPINLFPPSYYGEHPDYWAAEAPEDEYPEDVDDRSWEDDYAMDVDPRENQDTREEAYDDR